MTLMSSARATAEGGAAPVDQARADAYLQALRQWIDKRIQEAIAPLLGPQTTTLWFTLSTGSTTALATTDYIEAPVDFPFIITGHKMLSRDNGGLVLSVRRAAFVDYPSFTAITGSAPPTLVSHKVEDETLAGWTTQIAGDDVLAIGITSNAGALTTVSLGLRIRKLGVRT